MAISFSDQLKRQLRYVEISAKEYDIGNRDEAIRVATCLRVMFHQTALSTSLLSHLNAESIELCSTSEPGPIGSGLGLKVANNLITNPFTGEMRASPWLAAAPHKTLIPFAQWWNEVVVYNSGTQVTRRNLVLWAANKDGGAHVGEVQHAGYEKVARGLDFTFTITNRTTGESLITKAEEIHLAALRQFAYEVSVSPDLLKLAYPLS